MAKKQPAQVGTLMDRVLGDVARKTGSGAALGLVWREVAGELVARHAWPVSLAGATLTLAVDDARWRQELEAQAGPLLSRLAERLGRGMVERLAFELRR